MAKKTLQSGFQLPGIAPNILLQDIEQTAPFIFKGEVNTTGKRRAYLDKIRFYKKNLKQLKFLGPYEYFNLCLSAHWSTAGTFVPTDVDHQIRYKLWQHPKLEKYREQMVTLTLEALNWDFSEVTCRSLLNSDEKLTLSTHEGTWFSVAIGAYCAVKREGKKALADELAHKITAEINREIQIAHHLKEKQNHIDFITAAPLLAHNFGDLDRVMVMWDMHEKDHFCKSIYRLGHEINSQYSSILVYAGQINKVFTATENHRHMALRKPKCLRRSKKFLIHVGPFLEKWGEEIGRSDQLSMEEKAQVITALFMGSQREKTAVGYARALRGILNHYPDKLNEFEQFLPFDLLKDLEHSSFYQLAKKETENFNADYINELERFVCPKTRLSF